MFKQIDKLVSGIEPGIDAAIALGLIIIVVIIRSTKNTQEGESIVGIICVTILLLALIVLRITMLIYGGQ